MTHFLPNMSSATLALFLAWIAVATPWPSGTSKAYAISNPDLRSVERFCAESLGGNPLAAAGARLSGARGHNNAAIDFPRDGSRPFQQQACVEHLRAVAAMASESDGELVVSGLEPMSLEVLSLFHQVQALRLNCYHQKLDLSRISGLTQAKSLWLLGCQIDSLEFVRPLVALRQLLVTNGPGAHVALDPLKGLRFLRELKLDGIHFPDVSPLSYLISLSKLTIQDSNLSALTPLMSLTNLESLTLIRNPSLSDIHAVQFMSNLTGLDVAASSVESIDAVRELSWLELLTLNQNRIRSIEPIRQLSRLRMLRASHNLVQDISPIARRQSKIQIVDLFCNPITDAAELNALADQDLLPVNPMSLTWNVNLESGLSATAKGKVQLGRADCAPGERAGPAF